MYLHYYFEQLNYVFLASHDLTLEGTTNVAELFPASRMETFTVEGVAIKGYYAVNFTLGYVLGMSRCIIDIVLCFRCSEIKTLRIRQRFEGRSTLYNWLFSVPTLEEIIQWQLDHFAVSGRLVGIYPELKHPDWYNEIGYPMEDLFVKAIKDAGYHYDINDERTPRDVDVVLPLAIQCFKPQSLKYLAKITNIPLVQLIGTSAEYPTPLSVWNEKVLDDVATYAQVAGPGTRLLVWGRSW
jgi:glycerophosphoryl diester phosphodiesterase